MPKKHQPAGVGMTPSKTEFGKFIRARRLELDLRQVLFIKRAGLAQNLVSMLEIGTRKYLNGRQLERLARALQCDSEELRKRMPVKHTAEPKTELGKLICSRREELGLTLEDFAKKMRMTPQQAKRLEVGKNPGIHYGLVKLLASALELDPSAFARFVGTTRKEQTKSELGQLVRTRRKELTISMNQLAENLGVSRQFVSQIEFGQRPLSENDDMIERLAKVLKLNVNDLQAVRPTRRLKQMDRSPLGGFLAAKRLELRLTQREVSERAEITIGVVSGVETGRFHPNPNLLDKFAKALGCQIPPELIPTSQDASASSVIVHLSNQNLSDLEKIKELSDIRANSEVIRKALKLLRLLLEKQRDKCVVLLCKDKDVVELESLL